MQRHRLSHLTQAVTFMFIIGAAMAGCSTAPLGGTTWRAERIVTGESPEFQEMVVEFRRSGRLVTSTRLVDGSTEVNDQERFSVSGGLLRIEGPDRSFDAMYRLEEDGNLLSMVSWDFFAVFRRLDGR